MESLNVQKRIEVNSKAEAWQIIDGIFPTDYAKDEKASAFAGYPVYRSTAEDHYYDYICDLNDRFEINLSGGQTVNVWFSNMYMKAKALAHENMVLRQEIDQIQSDLEVEKFLNGIYESKIKTLENENADLKSQLEEMSKQFAEMAAKIQSLKAILD